MGRFVVFEGMDRSGKSTNLDFASDYLISKGYTVKKLREPGAALVSEKLRSIILDPDNTIYPKTELLLFLASRNQFVEEVAKPLTKEYDFVLCDRFNFSTVAYQGFGRGIDVDTIIEMDKFARDGFEPSHYFYFDISMETFHARARESVDRMENENESFFKKVLDGYKFLASNENKCYIIDSNCELNDVQNEVTVKLNQLIGE